MSTLEFHRDSFRIVRALAVKDIVDAIRNRTTLGIIASMVFLVAVYRFLPTLESASIPPRAAVFTVESSRLVSALEDSVELDLMLMDTQDQMEAYVANMSFAVLGLIVPAGFDETLGQSEAVELDGYVAHWMRDDAVAETRAFFEAKLSELAGQPVAIDLDGHEVRPRVDSRGYSFLTAVSLVVVVSMMGLAFTPSLFIEEKRARTLDALLVSPVTGGQVVLGKAIAGLFYALTAGIVILLFNQVLVAHWELAILGLISGSLFVVSLGLLLGTVLELQQQQRLWTFILAQPLLLPVFLVIMTDVLPEVVVNIMKWIPTVALSTLFRLSFAESAPCSQYGPQLAIVLGSTALLLVVTAQIVRRSE